MPCENQRPLAGPALMPMVRRKMPLGASVLTCARERETTMKSHQTHAYWDYHLHNVLLNGVAVNGQSPFYSDIRSGTGTRLKRLNFNFDGYRYDTFQRNESDTPYALVDGGLLFRGRPLSRLPFSLIPLDDDEWGSERAWWFKSFPSLDHYYDLRLNPINACSNLRYASGADGDLKGCVFCHRCYDQPRIVENRAVVPLEKLFAEIEAAHGSAVFGQIGKAMVVTGDLSSENEMVELLETIYHRHLQPRGFGGVFSAVTTLIRSPRGIQRLANLDDTLFEFPVECFERRPVILGERKGIPLDEVMAVLRTARRHFRSIRLNYLVGLDHLAAVSAGFGRLQQELLVDDVISNIFIPYDSRALKYRLPESFEMRYLYGYRKILRGFGLSPKRTGPTKDAFSPFFKSVMEDELLLETSARPVAGRRPCSTTDARFTQASSPRTRVQ